MADVFDVAAYILSRGGAMSTMKLQKLCYYAQGWSLVWDEKPLFSQEIQAWANGPVVYDLYREHRGRFMVDDSWPVGNRENLTAEEKETIDVVLRAYGSLTGQQLSDKTHEERPWLEARGDLPRGASSARTVSLEVMQDYFGGLAQSS